MKASGLVARRYAAENAQLGENSVACVDISLLYGMTVRIIDRVSVNGLL